MVFSEREHEKRAKEVFFVGIRVPGLLIMRSEEDLKERLNQAGFSSISREMFQLLTEKQIRNLLYEKLEPDFHGDIIIPPERLILAQTDQFLEVPTDCTYRMGDFFIDGRTRQETRLRTNVSAPDLHPGSVGHQAFEIYSQYPGPYKARISNLFCPIYVNRLTTDTDAVTPTFSSQEPDRVTLANPYRGMKTSSRV